MTDVYVSGKRFRLDPAKAIGKGGEADIYRLDQDRVLKIFKGPDHPDVAGFPAEERAAAERLEEHQRKLRDFPKRLPASVVTPMDLATDRAGARIYGYAMRFIDDAEVLLRYAERGFRSSQITNEDVANLFLGMHPTLRALHSAGVVVGDFNDLNVLVSNGRIRDHHFIDADSYQFGRYLCRVYTERFVDPLLCDLSQTRPTLKSPHGPASDWYAFSVMLMKSLTFCDPYGGVYKAPKGKPDVPHAARPLRRISVFDPNVKYPKPAIPYGHLPDELLAYFHAVFVKDERGEFPARLLQGFRWTRCLGCGAEHARPSCPSCQKTAPAAVKATSTVRGKVTATTLFKTAGQILFATAQKDRILFVYQVGTDIFRDGGVLLASSLPASSTRFRIHYADTLVGIGGDLHVMANGRRSETISVDRYGNLPVFDANADRKFWLASGSLMRDGKLGPEPIGEVLAGQTLFWVGPRFGFGFYRAGELTVAFVFDAEHRGLNDSVRFPKLRGHLVDCTAVFSNALCWFFASLKYDGRVVNHCYVVDETGKVLATAEADQGSDSWLSEIRGKCAAGKSLFAVTDEGLVRVEVSGGSIQKTSEFPDTEPFVDAGCHLLAGQGGLYVVDRKEIRLLKMS